MKRHNPGIRQTLFALLILVSCTLTQAMAQSNTPFTGTWQRTAKTSLSGTDYGNGVPTKLQISRDAKTISVVRTNITGKEDEPESNVTEVLQLGGGTQLTSTPGGKIKKLVTKPAADGKGLIMTYTLSDPTQPDKVLSNVTEEWSLSADGHTLTLLKKFASTTDENDRWSMQGVYTKQ